MHLRRIDRAQAVRTCCLEAMAMAMAIAIAMAIAKCVC